MSKINKLKQANKLSGALITNNNPSFKSAKDIKITQKEILIKFKPKRNVSVSNCFNSIFNDIEKRSTTNRKNNSNLNIITYKTKDGYGNDHNLLNLRKYPPKQPECYIKHMNLNPINIYSNSNNNYGLLYKGSVPIFLYNHLLIETHTSKTEASNNIESKITSRNKNNKKKLKRLVTTVRNITKIVSIVFYSYGK